MGETEERGMDWTNENTWKFINTFAPWFSALGTFTAVLISLRIANTANRFQVRVFAARTRLVNMGQRVSEGESVVMVSATNLGRRQARITGLYWRRLGQRGAFQQIASDHRMSARIPSDLAADGGRADFVFPESSFLDPRNRGFLRKLFGGRFARLRSRFARVGVYTTVGKTFDGKLDKGLVDWFIKLAKSSGDATGSTDRE
jgi:hypothetical protein